VSSIRKQVIAAPHRDERLVAQALDRIAAILIRAGFDLPRAERLLRQAFIVAAAKAARTTNQKVTQSQIASIAGVSRLEVRRNLSKAKSSSAELESRQRSRIERVIVGWRNDPRFGTKNGKPRALSFLGARSEFEALARKYGRDVTAKTLRVRLLSLGLVAVKAGKLRLQREAQKPGNFSAASADIRFIASQLANIDFEQGRRAYLTRRVSISARDKKTVLALRRIATTRLETFLSSLGSSSAGSRLKKDVDRNASHRLIVSSTVTIQTEGTDEGRD
jgi:hypothetical protein